MSEDFQTITATGSGKSEAEVAFDLVNKLKGQGVWGERNLTAILDMYAECLDATRGMRKYAGQNRFEAPVTTPAATPSSAPSATAAPATAPAAAPAPQVEAPKSTLAEQQQLAQLQAQHQQAQLQAQQQAAQQAAQPVHAQQQMLQQKLQQG